VRTQWQEDVRARLVALGITSKDLARKVGCAQSTMHDTLTNPAASHSSLVPRIHAAIGWDPPPDPQSPPLPSADAIEMGHLFDKLPEDVRRKLRDDAEFYLRLATSKPR
jgi:lambda repressor-like predicted transcriptional regulator